MALYYLTMTNLIELPTFSRWWYWSYSVHNAQKAQYTFDWTGRLFKQSSSLRDTIYAMSFKDIYEGMIAYVTMLHWRWNHGINWHRFVSIATGQCHRHIAMSKSNTLLYRRNLPVNFWQQEILYSSCIHVPHLHRNVVFFQHPICWYFIQLFKQLKVNKHQFLGMIMDFSAAQRLGFRLTCFQLLF